MFKHKILSIIKNLLILICILFLANEIYKNLDFIKEKFSENDKFFILILLIHFAYLNLLNMRNYSIFKICARYSGKFYDWSQIFYESLFLNLIFSHAGSIYRAIELKKRGLEYKKYIGLFYILFASYILINTFLVLIELSFILELSLQFKINLLLIILFFFILFIYTPKILDFFIKNIHIIKKNYGIKIETLLHSYSLIYSFIRDQSFLKKTILCLLIYGVAIHALDLCIFYLSAEIILTDIGFKTILVLFGLNFILERIPFISSIPGLSEILFASISVPLGLYLHQAIILKLLLRIITFMSTLINYLIFYFLNKLERIKN